MKFKKPTLTLKLLFVVTLLISCNKFNNEEKTGIESDETIKNEKEAKQRDSIELENQREEVYLTYTSLIHKYGVKTGSDIMLQKLLEINITHERSVGIIASMFERYEKNQNNDFEYSEYWRKEAYINTKKYLIEILKKNKPSCKVIGQGYYQPGLVKYLGGQGYQVIVLCEFDCNQNYINEKYFWVEAYYLGNNNWSMDIVHQKFND